VISIVTVVAAVGCYYYLIAGAEEEGVEVAASPALQPEPHYEVIATVTSMIDGDTTWVRIENIVEELDPEGEVYEGNSEKVRYGGGVDAPETWMEGGPEATLEATEFIENLIPVGTTVYLDLNSLSRGGQTDRPYRGTYERLIAVIYAVIDGRWININAELVRWGLEEYPDHDWLQYVYFPSEWDPYEWLGDDYLYARGFVEHRDVMVLILPEEKTGAPGENVAFRVSVKNIGNIRDTYSLVADDNIGWNFVLIENLIEHISPNQVRTIKLVVTIPEDTENCTRDYITITATSQETEEVSDSDICAAHAVGEISRGVSVSISPSENVGAPDNSVTFTVTVTNTGGVSDSYTLTATNGAGWEAELGDSELTVPPGGNRQTTLSVTVGSDATEGESTEITLTVTSQADSTVSDSAKCTAKAEAGEATPQGSPWVTIAGVTVSVVVVIGVFLMIRLFLAPFLS